MPDDAFAFAIPRMRLAYFAKDREILAPRLGAATHLNIVQRGAVGSRVEDPRVEPEPPLGPGECFPVGALSAGGPPTKIYHALQDTFCYQLPRDDFLEWRRLSPELERFCAHAITETLQQSLAQLAAHYTQRAAEQQSIARPLSGLVRREPVTCPGDEPLATALAKMSEARVRTIVVVGPGGAPIGMFTLVDLLRRVVLGGKPLTTPLADVMSAPVVALPAAATAHEAMATMAAREVRQIVIVDGSRLVGVVNERDLLHADARVSMRQVLDGLTEAHSIAALKRCADDIRNLAHSLLAQGVTSEPLTRTIAALNDALARRAIELVLAHHARRRVRLVLARARQRGPQRADVRHRPGQRAGVHDDRRSSRCIAVALLAFAQGVNDAFAGLGIPLCEGGVMAGNLDYCLTFDEWKERFLGWLTAPTPPALLGANIVFDFRPLFGNAALASELRSWLFGYTMDNAVFLRLMTQNALESGPPLGLIRTFATDEDAPIAARSTSRRAARAFSSTRRVYSRWHSAFTKQTPSRGCGRQAARSGSKAGTSRATIEAFHFLQLLRLRLQDDTNVGKGINRLKPDLLNEVDQRMLKESFRQARKLQERLRQTYGS